MHEVVAAALVREGRVLLVHRSLNRRAYPGVWDLPGGHIETSETELAALTKEMREELGVQIATSSAMHCVGSTQEPDGNPYASAPGLSATGREHRQTSLSMNMTRSDGSGLRSCLRSPSHDGHVDRKAYQLYRAEVMEMLAEEDPMGLVEIGFPRDEYAPELPYLMRLSKPAASDVREVFLRMFDVELPEDFARRIALRLSEMRARHGLA